MLNQPLYNPESISYTYQKLVEPSLYPRLLVDADFELLETTDKVLSHIWKPKQQLSGCSQPIRTKNKTSIVIEEQKSSLQIPN